MLKKVFLYGLAVVGGITILAVIGACCIFIIAILIKEPQSKPAVQTIVLESTPKDTSFEHVSKIVMERMDKGESAQVALGDFEGLEVKWTAKPEYIPVMIIPRVYFRLGN